MCTLILGRDVLGAGSVILAANRDEDPARPTDPPRVLLDSPRLAGGRDRVAGGTWLAVRERRAAVALLNRRPPEGAAPAAAPVPPSRGLLTLEVAGVANGERSLAEAAAERVRALAGRDRYAPFTLLFASPERCWWWRGLHDGAQPLREIGPGWHVVTHEDLDDASEPRTAWLMGDLAGFAPRDVDQAFEGLLSRLRHHGDGNHRPAVCIHEGRMRTVSSSLVWLAGGRARYLHAEGRPCEAAALDHSSLTADGPSARETP